MVLASGGGAPLRFENGVDPDDPGDVELFDPPKDRRGFAPPDVLRLLVGLALIAVGIVVSLAAQETVKGLEDDLVEVFDRLPNDLESLVLSVAQLATSLVPAVAIVVLLWRRRWRVALVLVAAGVVANLVMAVADALVIDQGIVEALDAIRNQQDLFGGASYPSSSVLASTTAVVTVAAPWLSRPWRRTLWWGVGLLALLRLLAVAEPAFDLILSIGVGTVVGSLVTLLFGSPSSEPQPAELLAELRALGLRPRRIARAPRLSGTALQYEVLDEDGTEYDVILRMPEDRDADLLSRTARALRYQPSEVQIGYSTLKRRLEHEALLLTLAERAGARVPAVVRIGTTPRGAIFLVTRATPTRPATADDLRSAEVQADVWTQVMLLHRAGIAHRHLALDAIDIDGEGRVWLADFDGGQTAPSGRELARDVAELLVEIAIVNGPDAAVDVAVDVIGSEEVAPSLRMLQPLALPPSTRDRAKQRDREVQQARAAASEAEPDAADAAAEPRPVAGPPGGLLEELRASVNRATGEPGLELARLERIRPRTLLIIAASSLAFYTLLPQLANLDETLDAFADAEVLWIIAAVAASAVTYAFAALAFQGAVKEELPFGANLRVQVASSFATLVGPGGAGGYALGARFLQRTGVGGAEAATSVAVKTIAGFAMHVVLLAGFVLWAGHSDFGEFRFPSSTTILLVIALVLAAVGVLVAIGPVRQRFLVPLWEGLRTGLGQIGQVFRRPARVAELFGGSIGLSLVYVVALACSMEAFGGGDIGFAQIGASYLVAVAIATLAPTPGGLGALESALIAALVGFGTPDGVAVSAVLTFRLATFWLPILPGWGILTWMQRNGEL